MDTLRIDRILLDATTSWSDVDVLISRLRDDRSSACGIVIPPVFAKRTVEALRESDGKVIGVAGYPLGLAKSTVKAIEATSLAKDGVDAVELTPLASNILAGDFEALRAELLEVVRGVRAAKPSASVHVRLDLDTLRLDLQTIAALDDAITRGACDGIALEAQSIETSREILRAWPADSALERKLIMLDGGVAEPTDAERAVLAGWVTAIGQIATRGKP